jgi:HSP20 family protein
MTLTMLRDPFLADLRLADDLSGRVFGNGHRPGALVPALEIRQTDEECLVAIDLPGVKTQDVTVELTGQVLMISVSGSRAPLEGGQVLRSERPSGSFSRRLTPPKGVDADTIVADHRDGVLQLRIPKRAEAKPKRIAIGGAAGEAISH